MNPLHADPGAAISAGYPQPILHGMATFGIASFAVLQAAGLPPAALRTIEARFTAPVYPGETLRIELDERAKSFDMFSVERGIKVLSQGRASFNGSRADIQYRPPQTCRISPLM
jgi:acyl dehydratase